MALERCNQAAEDSFERGYYHGNSISQSPRRISEAFKQRSEQTRQEVVRLSKGAAVLSRVNGCLGAGRIPCHLAERVSPLQSTSEVESRVSSSVNYGSGTRWMGLPSMYALQVVVSLTLDVYA